MDIWSILILILAVQGVFNLSLLVISALKKKQSGQWYLIFISIALLWFLLEFLSVRQTFKVPFNLFYGTRYGSWFLLGPLTFFFFRSITQKQWKLSWKQAWHFLPFLIFTIFIPIISNESLSYRQIHYGMLAVFDYRPKKVTPFEYLYSTIFYSQFIHLAIYLATNSIIIQRYKKALKNEYSSIKNLRWISVFNGLIIVIMVLSSTYLYILFQSDLYTRALDYIYVLPIGLFVYAVSYKLSSQQWLPITKNDRYQSSSLKEVEKTKYIQQLEQLMADQKPYLQNDLRLKHLAELLHIKSHHLSQLINEHYHHSFFDFINQYRVKAAEQFIKSSPKSTLLEIAFDAGFNNKTSFVNAFKKFNGQTPSVFRKQFQS
jgi:AraC-like DNA-binding protein